MTVVAAGLGTSGCGGQERGGEAVSLPPPPDAFAYEPPRRSEFEARAAVGVANVLYERSPGGAVATARRVERFRARIESAAERTGADPDLLEAIVFLESAGRPNVIAGDDPEAAAGLAQILASTGQDLLGMRVELRRSRRLTSRIARAEDPAEARRLLEERARVDERFDPRKALLGAGRYLALARARFGADDLAIESYHMGIGNLETVIRRYLGEPQADDPVRELVEDGDLSYAQIYFDSSPVSHPRSWELLAEFGDESADYYWKVLAAQGIMRLHRESPRRLRELARRHAAARGAEQVLHPPSDAEMFDGPRDLSGAWRAGDLAPIPEASELGYRLAADPSTAADPALYRALRPEAVAALMYLAGQVRQINGGGELEVSAAVSERENQGEIWERSDERPSGYSLHTTGWAFDVERRYESDRQAEAFQFVLDRLRVLAVIDYAVERDVVHVTVSGETGPISGGS